MSVQHNGLQDFKLGVLVQNNLLLFLVQLGLICGLLPFPLCYDELWSGLCAPPCAAMFKVL